MYLFLLKKPLSAESNAIYRVQNYKNLNFLKCQTALSLYGESNKTI